MDGYWYFVVILVRIFLMIDDVEYLSMSLLATKGLLL